ncbi:ADP-ribosylglycohydrolase family protein [Salisediminibacterium beveridgei]|uniref:Hydrolase, putative n=1 Tax=Salisediminibacterium beveridgei TaxID=632773 RepID=A0A1D7QXV7_9BACI|nr:ADP-ribosylglycohydrolase family protein [Salisediminibacterium beveridgei]AOM83847.1 hydrolase, putative [Salisediminibacterium beveridgei]
MLGAMVGDIVGSRFEWNNYRKKDFEFFTAACEVTDDTIMSLAVAEALLDAAEGVGLPLKGMNEQPEEYKNLSSLVTQHMQTIGRRYPDCGFGGMFGQWVFHEKPEPYNSFGNGAAMRISPAGWLADSESGVKTLSKAVTEVTHNHPEGIKGAEACAMAIFLARNGKDKQAIRKRMTADYYSLDFSIDDIRDTYEFNETCQETVPQAITAFLDGADFEDVIRVAISCGGDSDTLTAIAGSIAEAYYGVPKRIEKQAITYLDPVLLKMYQRWSAFHAPG